MVEIADSRTPISVPQDMSLDPLNRTCSRNKMQKVGDFEVSKQSVVRNCVPAGRSISVCTNYLIPFVGWIMPVSGNIDEMNNTQGVMFAMRVRQRDHQT